MSKSLLLSNKYVKFGISCFNLLYLILIFALAIWTFLYKLVFTSQTGFDVFYIILSVIFATLMLLTKNQIMTRIVALSIPLPIFFLTLFNIDTPIMFIPPLVVAIVMFFACGAGDTAKVLLGSLYLLMFVVGMVGYTIISTLFGGSAVETRLDANLTDTEITSIYNMEKINQLNQNSVSPDGKFRYYILDVQDNDRGKVIVVVEPNDLDKHYKFFDLIEAGYSSRIAKYPTRGATPDIEWVINEDYDPNDEGSAQYKLRYRFGEAAEWKTSTINIPSQKNYLRFLNVN